MSPLNHAAEFQAPVLLIHGKVDTRVDYFESEDMYKALKAASKKADLKIYDYGTHFLNDAINRKDAMTLIAKFLDENLH